VKLTATPANANILTGIKDQGRGHGAEFYSPKTENSFYMEIRPLDFLIGLSLGLALGAGGTMLVSRIRGWLGYSETGRLRAENRVFLRRLAAKDRHIGRMLAETQRLAERLGQKQGVSQAEDTGLIKID
jgi:hypothetical protein